MTRQLLSVAISLPPTLPEDTAVSIASMAGRLGFSAVHLAEAPTTALLSRLADAAAPALVV
ncbi:MAG: hypothetical protein ACRDOK_25505, partial [Streptosporangiaceae bacterium]